MIKFNVCKQCGTTYRTNDVIRTFGYITNICQNCFCKKKSNADKHDVEKMLDIMSKPLVDLCELKTIVFNKNNEQ